MEDFKANRLDKELWRIRRDRCAILEEVYYGYLTTQPLDAIIPGLGDVALRPESRALIGAPAENNVTPADFEDLVSILPQFSTEWRQAKINELMALIRSCDIEVSEADLGRPFIRFGCGQCGRGMGYPRILVHGCLTESSENFARDGDTFDALRSYPWNQGADVAFRNRFYRDAMVLLWGCGFDPTTILPEDVKPNSTFFECLHCYDAEKGLALFVWDAAVISRCV